MTLPIPPHSPTTNRLVARADSEPRPRRSARASLVLLEISRIEDPLLLPPRRFARCGISSPPRRRRGLRFRVVVPVGDLSATAESSVAELSRCPSRPMVPARVDRRGRGPAQTHPPTSSAGDPLRWSGRRGQASMTAARVNRAKIDRATARHPTSLRPNRLRRDSAFKRLIVPDVRTILVRVRLHLLVEAPLVVPALCLALGSSSALGPVARCFETQSLIRPSRPRPPYRRTEAGQPGRQTPRPHRIAASFPTTSSATSPLPSCPRDGTRPPSFLWPCPVIEGAWRLPAAQLSAWFASSLCPICVIPQRGRATTPPPDMPKLLAMPSSAIELRSPRKRALPCGVPPTKPSFRAAGHSRRSKDSAALFCTSSSPLVGIPLSSLSGEHANACRQQ